MRAEGQAHIERIEAALALVRQSLDWERALRRLDELDARVQDPNLWDDPKQAQAVTQEQKRLETAINTVREIEAEMADAMEFVEMGEAEGDAEVEREGLDTLASLGERADRDKVQALLSGEADGNDTYLQINAGAGGTESQDWADMLLRMYARWAERRGFKVETVEYAAGEQAGIKSATLLIKGENAYGYAKTESGVHRLVRISPYDSSARRHTSFSSVWVYPVIDDDIDIEINPSDLKIDTYRASGAGGQHVNTTDSAVRITHQPTGIVVASQNDRSQHKNRATAMNMLKARLFEREMAEREAAASGEYQEKSEIGWGHQIRSYVLQPYQMVKDLRTGVQSPTPDDVLDGALDQFISAALAQRVTGETVDVEDED
ncbi:peptide chain release factor 2 [Erythrobacter sp.]|jgi:peptide chain release factor 2|uniref:peptide chain release factor 2 n=1 Tax=Qipengyuania sp. NPDC077410 TaxID=3364496 RepID=UPI000C366952|nr:peptide chain release factor 2 [Sphingomonadaceae bacterium]MBL4896135.1 peptide chain release factor 2 [Erythrobacter sp.]MDB2694785.1 peptide chain release factor 2 [Erythrobacter sp.]MEC7952023.1 peptide chain release factor 2 [Pseudomonadota bacterium]QPL38617.1 peptide chain release factor 2 [Erythrobacter sp. A30-3]|tara:strand:+ start:1672 stop:2799 length:1128 start_codon:yes stop_codon:yes gene_type:complete